MIPQRHPWLLAFIPQAIANVLYVQTMNTYFNGASCFVNLLFTIFLQVFNSRAKMLLYYKPVSCGIEPKQKHSNLLECGLWSSSHLRICHLPSIQDMEGRGRPWGSQWELKDIRHRMAVWFSRGRWKKQELLHLVVK